jgi:hypothetical protein
MKPPATTGRKSAANANEYMNTLPSCVTTSSMKKYPEILADVPYEKIPPNRISHPAIIIQRRFLTTHGGLLTISDGFVNGLQTLAFMNSFIRDSSERVFEDST